jgi:hypothetical protein
VLNISPGFSLLSVHLPSHVEFKQTTLELVFVFGHTSFAPGIGQIQTLDHSTRTSIALIIELLVLTNCKFFNLGM